MARILAVVPDLMLSSRVVEALSAAGHEVEVTTAPPESSDADAIVCDLDAVDPAALPALGLPSLGFYSHVEVETRRAAEGAGIDLVVPRSRMSRELPELVGLLLSGG
jgi:hypothetical protein